jgi:hypothetical protein
MKRFLTVFILPAAMAAAPMPDCKAVPGWSQQGEARSYVSDNLFEYMDGNAEGYLIYGFQRMQGVTCQAGEDTLVIDISEMADPDSAYGIYAANRDSRQPTDKIGTAGQIVPRRAIFVKDKYYVEIAANPAKDHTPALKAFVAVLEKSISGRTELPEALTWFPTEKLVPDSTRLIPESVLGLRLLKRGYVAQYEFGKAFLVFEESPQTAAGVLTKLKARMGETKPAQIGDEAFMATDKYLGGMCVFRKGSVIGGYANLKDQDGAALASALAGKVK